MPQATRVAELARTVDETREQVRSLTKGLFPLQVEASALAESLAELAAQYSRLSTVECSFASRGSAALDDDVAATHLYRIM